MRPFLTPEAQGVAHLKFLLLNQSHHFPWQRLYSLRRRSQSHPLSFNHQIGRSELDIESVSEINARLGYARQLILYDNDENEIVQATPN